MRKRKRVLAVDDEQLILLAIRENLRLAGYEVLEARTGKDALTLIQTEHPDLVILDILMGDMNGWEVLSRIREDLRLTDLPVVMVTGLGESHHVGESLRRGATRHLTKPFYPDHLIRMIEELLGPSKSTG